MDTIDEDIDVNDQGVVDDKINHQEGALCGSKRDQREQRDRLIMCRKTLRKRQCRDMINLKKFVYTT